MFITLKIHLASINQTKAMRFSTTMTVSEAIAVIYEKVHT